jgi:hypothetical protein
MALVTKTGSTWADGFRPTKVRVTYTGYGFIATISVGELAGGNDYGSGQVLSGAELDLNVTSDIERINLHDTNRVSKIEFYVDSAGGETDLDGDGIHNDMDEEPLVASTRFSDRALGGTTSGRILALDTEITVEIMDVLDPDGVKVIVSGPSGGDARIKINGSTGTYSLAPGEHVLTSGSVRLDVLQGSAEVEFTIGGAMVVIGVVEGVVILEETIVDGELQELVVDAVDGIVTVNYEVVDPGQSLTIMSVWIDIKPGSDPNCINNNGHGVIPVAILSSTDFDATQVDPLTVMLDGQAVRIVGKKGKLQAHIEDANGDGLDDLVMQIEDEDGTYQEGDTMATLTGETFDGTSILGTDTICIVP